MLNKNMAKGWQRGWYQIYVGDNEVAVRTMRNGIVWERCAQCHPDDEFSLSDGVKVAMERLEEAISPNTIRVGDKVRIKDSGGMYCAYVDWVVNNVIDKRDIAYWQYNNSRCDTGHIYTVKYIAPHEKENSTLAYIINPHLSRGYLFDIDYLKREA